MATRILFVGNSFVSRNDLPRLVADLAGSAGRAVETAAIVAGGASLRRHVNAGAVSQALGGSRWDFVVLQEQSTLPIKNRKRYHENVRELDPQIRAAGAATVLYMTWARRAAPQSQGQITEAVRAIGEEIGARVAPVGVAWEAVAATHPQIDLFVADGSHPTAAGSFLAACVLCATILDDVEHPLTAPASLKVDATSAAVLMAAARQACLNPSRRSDPARTAPPRE